MRHWSVSWRGHFHDYSTGPGKNRRPDPAAAKCKSRLLLVEIGAGLADRTWSLGPAHDRTLLLAVAVLPIPRTSGSRGVAGKTVPRFRFKTNLSEPPRSAARGPSTTASSHIRSSTRPRQRSAGRRYWRGQAPTRHARPTAARHQSPRPCEYKGWEITQ